MDRISDVRLVELEAIAAAATEGPWVAERNGGRGAWIKSRATGEWAAISCGNTDAAADANGSLVEAAVSDLPTLVAEVKRLRLALDTARTFLLVHTRPEIDDKAHAIFQVVDGALSGAWPNKDPA